jgi:hypothetical protein
MAGGLKIAMSRNRPEQTPKRADAGFETSHPIRVGSVVVVLALDPFGVPFIEGYGRVEQHGAKPHWYCVHFIAERLTHDRFVNPEWQKAPERSLALLHEFWASKDLVSIEDFFPDDGVE